MEIIFFLKMFRHVKCTFKKYISDLVPTKYLVNYENKHSMKEGRWCSRLCRSISRSKGSAALKSPLSERRWYVLAPQMHREGGSPPPTETKELTKCYTCFYKKSSQICHENAIIFLNEGGNYKIKLSDLESE